MNHFITVLKKYAVFSGRASRAEYWYFILFNTIIAFVLGLITGSTGTSEAAFIPMIYNLALLVPSIAVGVRRMHDVNKSGWFLLIPFYNLYLAVTEGTHGPNDYGADPYGEDDLNQLVENY
jgi:uncharacterized membrane protein YhaH (DUF805 family)